MCVLVCGTFKQLNSLNINNFNNTLFVKEPYVPVLLFFSPDENISVWHVDIFIDGCNSFLLLDKTDGAETQHIQNGIDADGEKTGFNCTYICHKEVICHTHLAVGR